MYRKRGTHTERVKCRKSKNIKIDRQKDGRQKEGRQTEIDRKREILKETYEKRNRDREIQKG